MRLLVSASTAAARAWQPGSWGGQQVKQWAGRQTGTGCAITINMVHSM